MSKRLRSFKLPGKFLVPKCRKGNPSGDANTNFDLKRSCYSSQFLLISCVYLETLLVGD